MENPVVAHHKERLQTRKGECLSSLPSRSNRFLNREDGWYFSTREGKVKGPYKDRFSAETALKFMKLTHRWNY